LLLLVVSFLVAGAEQFIPASNPAIWTVGRTRKNVDGSLSFDWEGTQFYINVNKASYVKMHMKATGSAMGRFVIQVDGWEQSQVWVGGSNGASNEGVYLVADGLAGTVQVRVVSVLEPAFEGVNPAATFTFFGFATDGAAAPAGPPRPRRLELLGDSISAGFGSRGYRGAPDGCPVNQYTSGNYYTYNWFIAESFDADIVPIAWSGKGMYQNCCDNGETMPAYYLQTLGGDHYTMDWDFTRYVPQAMIINLGTNDFGHDSGPIWEKAFTDTYVDFVFNATRRYKQPKMPIFVAQGPMNCNANLNNSLHNAIQMINAGGGNAYYLNVCGPPNDGCGGHPGVVGHFEMFEQARPVIAKVMGWQ